MRTATDLKRRDREGQFVIDEGAFYEVENSEGVHYIPFRGEAGQSNHRHIVLDHFAVGQLDIDQTEPDRYFNAYETLKEAQVALLEFVEVERAAEEDDDDLCARCSARPATKGDFCDGCAALRQGMM